MLVRDVSETDRYGRLLRYVYIDNTSVNTTLVAEGWAEAMRYPPDTALADTFDHLEAEARAIHQRFYFWLGGCFRLFCQE
jgi:micrococcal nuclease